MQSPRPSDAGRPVFRATDREERGEFQHVGVGGGISHGDDQAAAHQRRCLRLVLVDGGLLRGKEGQTLHPVLNALLHPIPHQVHPRLHPLVLLQPGFVMGWMRGTSLVRLVRLVRGRSCQRLQGLVCALQRRGCDRCG